MPVVKKTKRRSNKAKKGGGITKPKDNIASRIISLEDLPADNINICIWGKSATGKTRIAGTFAEFGKTLHIVVSREMMNEALSIKGTPNVDVVPLMHPDELLELIDIIKRRKYKNVILDHVTAFGDMVLADIIGLEILPEQNSWGMASQTDYGAQGLQVKTYLRELLNLNCNVILLGQERIYKATKDEEDSIIAPHVSIASSPTIAGWIVSTVDYVAHTFIRPEVKRYKKKVGKSTKEVEEETGRKEFCLRVGPHETFMTKFRVPPGTELPDVLVNATAEEIFSLIEG